MDFIEKWFGIAPDGGNGMLELSLLVSVAAVAVLALVLYVRRQRRFKRQKT